MSRLIKLALVLVIGIGFSLEALAQESSTLSKTNLSGIQLRNVGPAFTSGRIADIALHPDNADIWYVATGSSGVWKTKNAGTTWKSIFDSEKSYSIGCITLDPNDSDVIWVGTGENVGGRHVAYGDGIYKSSDGGNTWKNMGLKESEHISKIIVHPDDSNVILVAAQGPLWSKGGERGLYKSVDGGSTWTKTLGDDEWVGVTDLIMDPNNSNILYAATWQRHRNVANSMGGGPGSGIYKSIDGGDTWTKSQNGIPGGALGKIGIAMSYTNSDNIYAAVELPLKKGAVYMSSNGARTWRKMSDTVSGGTGPHYYQELYTTPHAEGKLYLMDVRVQVSENHGKTFERMKERYKHSDNHSINFDPDKPDYILMGTDGGIFESHDGAESWRFIENLPLTQYYKVAVDDALPFYNIFGGTQDNGSHGGPSRTANRHGIRNADWFKTLFADGHQSAVEPGNPNIVYAETQQGGLYRIDLVTGEPVSIQPQSGPNEKYERYNWDAPIVISPHDPATLYFASYRVWKSPDRGDSWEAISGDLTRDQERFELPIMGRVQSADNNWDLTAMSVYNTITSLAVSPLQPGLVYAGTDDGIIQISEDDGGNWTKIEVGSIPGIPATAFVNNLYADLHDENVVYAALDNHKFGDLEPYLIKSSDKGRTWTSIVNNLPGRTLIWRIVQDHVDPNLLFLATEFGIYFSNNGGTAWKKVKSSANIAFRDITIQKRENDVVAASFGRGFFVLDDYSPLRNMSDETLAKDAHIFDVKDAPLFYARDVHGGSQGSSHYEAKNPPFGAIFTYYVKEGGSDLKSARKKAEREAGDGDIPFPGWDALDEEMNEVKDKLELVVRDQSGNILNRVKAKNTAGVHRTAWNLRKVSKAMVRQGQSGSGGPSFLVPPGEYTVTLTKTSNGIETELTNAVAFNVIPLQEPTLKGSSPDEIVAFQKEVEAAMLESAEFSAQLSDYSEELDAMELSLSRADKSSPELFKKISDAKVMLKKIQQSSSGFSSKSRVGERNPPSPQSRMYAGVRGLSTMYGPTALHKQTMESGKTELASLKSQLAELTALLPELHSALRSLGAPKILK